MYFPKIEHRSKRRSTFDPNDLSAASAPPNCSAMFKWCLID